MNDMTLMNVIQPLTNLLRNIPNSFLIKIFPTLLLPIYLRLEVSF